MIKYAKQLPNTNFKPHSVIVTGFAWLSDKINILKKYRFI